MCSGHFATWEKVSIIVTTHDIPATKSITFTELYQIDRFCDRLNVAASTNPASPAISPASSIVTKSSTACSAGDVSASTSGDWIYLFLKIALGIELFEIRPQVLGRLFVLNPSEYHFGARNFRFRILDVFLESRRLPMENE
jgi:hypothetical protein